MRRLAIVALLAGPSLAAGFELAGQIVPEAAASVSLHGASFPFEKVTLADAHGRFRFRKLAAGTYTVTVFEPGRSETARTVEVGSGMADAAGRVVVNVELDESATAFTDVLRRHSTIQASQLAIPDRAQKELEAARLRLARSDADGAITHLERAVEIAPRFMTAWNELGVIAYQSARYSDAGRDFRMALSADPDAYEPLVNLGGVLLNLGRPDEALRYNLNAALRRPRDPLANSQLGMSYYLIGKLDLAEQYLIVARKLDPAHFSHPQLILAEIHLRRNEREAAIGELKDFLARHPDSRQAPQVKAEIARLSAL